MRLIWRQPSDRTCQLSDGRGPQRAGMKGGPMASIRRGEGRRKTSGIETRRRRLRRTARPSRARGRTMRARILVVDDEPDEREALHLLLEAERHDVRSAGGGEEALAVIEAFLPHLVIMDWRMPGLAGAPLCRLIRERVGAPMVVIVSSADEAVTSGEDVLAALRKPLDLRELQTVLSRALPPLNGSDSAPPSLDSD
jgi:CheY-like chemotaxis protein